MAPIIMVCPLRIKTVVSLCLLCSLVLVLAGSSGSTFRGGSFCVTFSAAADDPSDAPAGDGDGDAVSGDAVRGWTALAFIATDNNLACGGRQNVENMLIGLSTNATNATDDGTSAAAGGDPSSSSAQFTVGAFIDETGYKPFTRQCPWSFPSSWILDGKPWEPSYSAKLVELAAERISEIATFPELDAAEADVLTTFIAAGFEYLGSDTDRRALWMSSHGNGWINFSLDWKCEKGQKFGKCEETMTFDNMNRAMVTGLSEKAPAPDENNAGELLSASSRPAPWPIPATTTTDDNDDDTTTTTALQAMEKVPSYPDSYVESKDRLSLLAFDACYMSTAEGISSFVRVADYVAVSMMTIPAQGQDYRAIFGYLSKNPTVSARDLGMTMVNTYTPYCDETEYGGPCTMVLVDASQWLVFEKVFKQLVLALTNAIDFKAFRAKFEQDVQSTQATPQADDDDDVNEEENASTTTASSSSCKCVGTNDGVNTAKYGADYGKSCSNWDQENCDAWWGPHGLGDWCCMSWCFVDAGSCPDAVPSLVAQGSELFYSFAACTDDADAKDDDDDCPYTSTDDETLNPLQYALQRVDAALVGISIAVQRSYVLQIPEGGFEANLVDLGSFLKELSQTRTSSIVDCCSEAAGKALSAYNDAVLVYAKRDDIPSSTTGVTIYFPRKLEAAQGSQVYESLDSSPLLALWRLFLTDVYFPAGEALAEQCAFNEQDTAKVRDRLTVAEKEAQDCACTGVNTGIDESVFGRGFGTSCAAWESQQLDEAGSSLLPLDLDKCNALWGPDAPRAGASVPLGGWCCQSWCYVSRECPSARLSSASPESLLFYSYSPTDCQSTPDEQCLGRYATSGEDTFEGTEEASSQEKELAEDDEDDDDDKNKIACPGFRLDQSGARLRLTDVTNSSAGEFIHDALKSAFCSTKDSSTEAAVKATQESCPCTGSNTGLDLDTLGTSYGTSCAPWDAGRCESLWGNTTELGNWCCQSWCYVDPLNCSPPGRAQATVAANKLLFYSYETCEDVTAEGADPAAAEQFAATCAFADSEVGAKFQSGIADTREECNALMESEPVTQWDLTADAQGGIPLRAYAWSGIRITGVNGSFATRDSATNPDAVSTFEPGESRVLFMIDRPAQVSFFGGAAGATLTQVEGKWSGAYLALYQTGTDPLQTASMASVTVDAGDDIRPVTIRIMYGPRCGAPLNEFVYGRLRMLLNATTLQQVTELKGKPVRPTLEVSHRRVDVEGLEEGAGYAAGFHGGDDDYVYDDSIFEEEEEGDEKEATERSGASDGFFIDVPRARGGAVLPYVLSVPDAHLDSFVQARNKVMRDASAKEGAGDPFQGDDNSQLFFPHTGYSRCHRWREDAPEFGLVPFTLELLGPMIRARSGGKQTIGEWTRVSPKFGEDGDATPSWSVSDEERKVLKVKAPHTFYRALQRSSENTTSEIVVEPELILTAFDQGGGASMATASRTPETGVVAASSALSERRDNPLALMVPIPCPVVLQGKFEGTFSIPGAPAGEVVSDGYVRTEVSEPGSAGSIFVGMLGKKREEEAGFPDGQSDACMTAWCASEASAEGRASGERVFGGYVATAYGACIKWERTETGPLRMSVAQSSSDGTGHTVLECPLSISDQRGEFGVNATLVAVGGQAPMQRWLCEVRGASSSS